MARTGPLCTCGNCRHYKEIRRTFRAQCQRAAAPCWLCGQRIDYTLGPDDPESWSLEHMFPRSTHPHLTEDPGNFAASHLDCNKRRQAKAQPLSIGLRSQEW